MDDTQIAKLKDQHGADLALVEANDGTELVFKKPARAEYNRWFNKREEDPSGAALQLAASCLVHPAYDQMILALDKQPALLMGGGGISAALILLAGVQDGGEIRKPKKL
jgi:hypothetical protein